jgi:hypothetical protein
MRDQRIADGYRQNEADIFQKTIDSLSPPPAPRKTLGVYRVGIGSGIILSATEKRGFYYGIVFGMHPTTHKDNSWGIDIGIFRLNRPFSLNTAKNKGSDNYYLPTGFMYAARGQITITNVQAKISVNGEPTKTSRVGVGFSFGMGWNHFNKVYIKSSYYEYDYAYNPGPGNVLYLSYSKEDSSNYVSNSFFSKKEYFYLMTSFDLYYMFSENWLLFFEPAYDFNIGSRLHASKTNEVSRLNCWSLKMGILFAFGKKKGN